MDPVHLRGLAGMFAAHDQTVTARTLASRLAGQHNLAIHEEGELALASFSSAPVLTGNVAGTCSCLVGELHDVDELARRVGCGTHEEIPVLLAHAYRRWGDGALEQLRGDFALVLWDARARRGFIAQSRTGIHTIYLHAAGERLAFATELNVLQQLLETRRGPDEVSLLAYISNRPLPGDRTMYEGIWRLGPGQCITLSNGRWVRRRYWAPRYSGVEDAAPAELREELWSLVRQAVRRRIDLEGTTAIIMSGGIDSAVVATAAAEVSAGRAELRSYSGVFPGRPEVDESVRIQAIAEHTRIPTTKCVVAPEGLLAIALEYLRAFDLPLTGPGYLLEHSLLTRATADGATVALDGQGGDEVFGTPVYLIADLLRAGRLRASLSLVRQLPGGDRASRAAVLGMWRELALKGLAPHGLNRLTRRLRGAERYTPDWLAGKARTQVEEHTDPWAWQMLEGPRWWAHRANLLVDATEPVGMAEYVRHRAALAGLQARPPLFDVDLMEHALRIPPQLNFDCRFDRPLVREAMAGRTPDSVRLWPRKSTLAPWYYDGLTGRDLGPIRDLLLASDAETRAYTAHERVAALLSRPPRVNESGWLAWVGDVWCLLTAECWLRQQSDSRFAQRRLEVEPLTRSCHSTTMA